MATSSRVRPTLIVWCLGAVLMTFDANAAKPAVTPQPLAVPQSKARRLELGGDVVVAWQWRGEELVVWRGAAAPEVKKFDGEFLQDVEVSSRGAIALLLISKTKVNTPSPTRLVLDDAVLEKWPDGEHSKLVFTPAGGVALWREPQNSVRRVPEDAFWTTVVGAPVGWPLCSFTLKGELAYAQEVIGKPEVSLKIAGTEKLRVAKDGLAAALLTPAAEWLTVRTHGYDVPAERRTEVMLGTKRLTALQEFDFHNWAVGANGSVLFHDFYGAWFFNDAKLTAPEPHRLDGKGALVSAAEKNGKLYFAGVELTAGAKGPSVSTNVMQDDGGGEAFFTELFRVPVAKKSPKGLGDDDGDEGGRGSRREQRPHALSFELKPELFANGVPLTFRTHDSDVEVWAGDAKVATAKALTQPQWSEDKARVAFWFEKADGSLSLLKLTAAVP